MTESPMTRSRNARRKEYSNPQRPQLRHTKEMQKIITAASIGRHVTCAHLPPGLPYCSTAETKVGIRRTPSDWSANHPALDKRKSCMESMFGWTEEAPRASMAREGCSQSEIDDEGRSEMALFSVLSVCYPDIIQRW